MPTGLRRYHQTGDLHFICVNCFRKRPIFDTPEPRDTLLTLLDETRRKYRFDVHGYVVMPTHVHLLMSEPANGLVSTAMQVLKQRFSRTRIEKEVWEIRYHDFNVWSHDKRVEKLEYMHSNPVVAGLCLTPADWTWSSYGAYASNEQGPVHVTTVWHRP